MYKKIKISLLTVLCCLGNMLSNYAQEIKAIETLKKVEAYYKATSVLDVEMEYNMYRGYTGNTITESYKGTMYKKGDISRVDILGNEIIDLPEAKLVLNKATKTITYSKKTNETLQKTPVDISMFSKLYKEVSTKVKGNIIVLEMVIKNPQIPVPYNKIVMYVNKSTYQIEKQELYLATKVPFVDKNGKGVPDAARMEVKFKTNPNPLKKTPKLEDYIRIDSKEKIHLSQNYAAYKIIDQTNS